MLYTDVLFLYLLFTIRDPNNKYPLILKTIPSVYFFGEFRIRGGGIIIIHYLYLYIATEMHLEPVEIFKNA